MTTQVKIDWLHLPPRVWNNVCKCYGAKEFGLNLESGFWVHRPNKGHCELPRLPTCVLLCDWCDIPFVPKFKKEVDEAYFGSLCDDCKP